MHEINEKQKKFAINFIIYFICFVFVCFVGLSRIFASTYTGLAELRNVTVVLISTDNAPGNPVSVPANSDVTYNYVTEVSYLVNNYNFSANVHYQLESHLAKVQFTNANHYSVIGANGESCLITYQSPDTILNNDAYPRWSFQCPHATSSVTITINNSSGEYLWSNQPTAPNYNIYQWTTAYLSYSDTSLSGSGSDSDNIINNQNQNTQNIINNQNQNTQNIINNQNQNTQDIINSNKACTFIGKSDTSFSGYLDSSGILHDSSYTSTTDYIRVYTSQELSIVEKSSVGNPRLCFFDKNKTFISCVLQNDNSIDTPISMPNDVYYLRMTIQNDTSLPQYKLCSNGNQAITDSINETNETNKGILAKIKELFSWFTNDDDADISGLDNMVGWLPPGPVDSIINLPLSFFNALTNTLSGTCRNVTLTIPFVNQTLTLYCFDAYMTQYLDHFGTFWNLVGFIVSIFILYNYLLSLYKWVDDTLTFRENNLPGYYGDNWGGGA